MEVLITTIFTQYFSSSRCLIVVTDESNIMYPQIVIPMIRINLDERRFSEKSKVLFNYFGCQDFIVNVNKPVSVFQDIEMEIKMHQDRFNKRKYIFIPGHQRSENIFDIFEMNEVQYVSDLLVIYEENFSKIKKRKFYKFLDYTDYIYSLWTHQYMGFSENNKPYLLDKWLSENSSFLLNNNLFPDKITNQKGRILRSAVFQYAPYVIVGKWILEYFSLSISQ